MNLTQETLDETSIASEPSEGSLRCLVGGGRSGQVQGSAAEHLYRAWICQSDHMSLCPEFGKV